MTYTQTTFSFQGTNVTDIISDIMLPDIRRPGRTPRIRRKVAIPGRDGTWDFGSDDKEDFEIEVDFTINADDSTDLMTKIRLLDSFLEGKGSLVFSDDVTTTYQAQVIKEIRLAKRVFSYIKSGTIIFECDA